MTKILRFCCDFEVALSNDLDTIDDHLDGPFLRSSLILRALKKRNEVERSKTRLTCGCGTKPDGMTDESRKQMRGRPKSHASRIVDSRD